MILIKIPLKTTFEKSNVAISEDNFDNSTCDSLSRVLGKIVG